MTRSDIWNLSGHSTFRRIGKSIIELVAMYVVAH